MPANCPVPSVVGRSVTDLPIYWFAELERAVEDGDFEAAAEAQRRLTRLGIQVKYGRPAAEREAINAQR